MKNAKRVCLRRISLFFVLLLGAACALAQQSVAPLVKATATPQFSPAAGTYRTVQSVSISDATAAAAIYYTTDGTTPSQASTPYTGAITVGTSETLKAIAIASGFSRSMVAQANYKLELPTPTPTFLPGGGSFAGPQSISINDVTQGATIYYTTDGTVPGTTSSMYTGPFIVGRTETVKAIAIIAGSSRSSIASAFYQIAPQVTATPTFSPPGGTYNAPQEVAISDTTPGATIYYTTDGTTPSINSTSYIGTITVGNTVTLKALSVAAGYAQSATAAATYLLVPAGVTEALIYSFSGGADGKTPVAALIQGNDGNFYGTTYQGGTYAVGTIFCLTPAGVETVVYSFSGGIRGSTDGRLPSTALIQGKNGNFYGTTELGGAYGAGTLFEATSAGSEVIVHSFGGTSNGAADGGFPQAALIQGSDGNFYGTTAGGGANDAGTVFKITPSGQESVLYSFGGSGHPLDGVSPHASLIQGNDGNFYGTTMAGGVNDEGTVFELTAAGAETVLYSFGSSSSDGVGPVAALTLGSDGNFYGTTPYGGLDDAGTVFVLSPTATETVLHSFGVTESDGAYPVASVIQASDGNFYGTTSGGGNAAGTGTVFQITAAGLETVLYSFALGDDSGDGSNSHAALLQATDGNFYGSTESGGANDLGAVFQLTPPSSGSVHR